MASVPQIQGMLLEEALLYLLQHTGYRTVENPAGDPTMEDGPAGLQVKGRGESHQIDAIADYVLSPPFSHAQRLLVEAKFLKVPVGLGVIRNAVGVLKDVGEFWAPGIKGAPPKKRFHYQYAILSASRYSLKAERYAFAQDVYLIPLAESAFFKATLDQIRRLSDTESASEINQYPNMRLTDLRKTVRQLLRDGDHTPLHSTYGPAVVTRIDGFVRSCREIRYALLAILGGGFPVFLVPGPDMRHSGLAGLPEEIDVQIPVESDKWYLADRDGRKLFSFDLPPELFALYDDSGMLWAERAANAKEDLFSEFYAIRSEEARVRLIRFKLDRSWLGTIRERIRERQRGQRGGANNWE